MAKWWTMQTLFTNLCRCLRGANPWKDSNEVWWIAVQWLMTIRWFHLASISHEMHRSNFNSSSMATRSNGIRQNRSSVCTFRPFLSVARMSPLLWHHLERLSCCSFWKCCSLSAAFLFNSFSLDPMLSGVKAVVLSRISLHMNPVPSFAQLWWHEAARKMYLDIFGSNEWICWYLTLWYSLCIPYFSWFLAEKCTDCTAIITLQVSSRIFK